MQFIFLDYSFRLCFVILFQDLPLTWDANIIIIKILCIHIHVIIKFITFVSGLDGVGLHVPLPVPVQATPVVELQATPVSQADGNHADIDMNSEQEETQYNDYSSNSDSDPDNESSDDLADDSDSESEMESEKDVIAGK